MGWEAIIECNHKHMQRSSEAVTCVCSKTEAPGESGEEQDEATQFCLFKPAHLSLTERERERERERRERERERENSNSKTLFSKDCLSTTSC